MVDRALGQELTRRWLVGPVADTPEGRHLRLGLRRFRLFASIFLVYLAYALDGLASASAGRIALAAVLLVLFVALYLGPLPIGVFLEQPQASGVALTGMSALMAAYLVLIGPGGLVFATYVCIAVVVALRPPVAVPVVLALCAATLVLPQHVDGWDVTGLQWAVAGPSLLTSVAMFSVRNGNRNNRELFRAQQEVERLAAEQERLRIARDLHDLLGHALTTVTIKAELASRLVTREPERAAREMTEVAELARRGLADVRATVAGYREVSLVTELAVAREVLRAAGISAELPAAVEQVPPDLRELFGWVVREGVTNTVRHGRAQHLKVLLHGRSIEVVDDGVSSAIASTSGSGLRGLTERAAGIGGRVTAGPIDPHGYRLRVEVPA